MTIRNTTDIPEKPRKFRLFDSKFFLVFPLLFFTATGDLGAVLTVKFINPWLGLLFIGLIAFIATHLAYRHLEIQIFTFVSIIVSAMSLNRLPVLIAVPGAIAGLMTWLVLCRILDNRKL